MKLKIESAKFNNPPLQIVAKALEKGLKSNYQDTKVEIVDCPNLKKWDCPSEGISGHERIIDVGGEPYMHDKRYIGTEFDYEEISKKMDRKNLMLLVLGQVQCLV